MTGRIAMTLRKSASELTPTSSEEQEPLAISAISLTSPGEEVESAVSELANRLSGSVC
jgi:hypothetical protein